MATSIPINIITGRTGTAHVSSSDDAAIWRGFVGNDNVTLSTDQSLSLDYSTKGTLVLSDGVLCVGGRMGRISNTKTVTYDLPASGYYRRTILLVRYAIAGDVESMALLTLQSDPSEDTSGADGASAAAELNINTSPTTDYVLYDFVCDEDGVVSGTMQTKMTVMETIPNVESKVNLLNVKEYTGERTSHDASRVYFSFETSAYDILNTSKVAIIKLWNSDGNESKTAICIFAKSSNLEVVWRTSPALMDINGIQTLIVFDVYPIKEGAQIGKLACNCATIVNGSFVIQPQNIPFDRASIFSWKSVL